MKIKKLDEWKLLFFTILILVLIAIAIYFIDFLNKNSGAIQTIFTMMLVIITGVYAYFNYKMTQLMSKQVVSEIEISNISLGSQFVESWFLERLKKQPEQINKDSFFEFELTFDVYNKSSGNGSIEKPVLILRFTNDDFEYKVSPITKDIDWEKRGETSQGVEYYHETVTDFGGTVFLQGGDRKKVELDYRIYKPTEEILNYIKKNLNSLEYFIEFHDNLNKKYCLKVTKVQPKKESVV